MPQKLSHQGKEKFMGMSKGFAPSKPAENPRSLNKSKPISMEELQAGFSNYFDDVPEPRVERTKHHLLKDTALCVTKRYSNSSEQNNF